MKKRKGLLTAIMFLVFSLFPIGCDSGTKEPTWVDYVSETHIVSNNWKTSSFMTDGVGIVSLKKVVDGDTAHFTDSNGYVIAGRYNGIDTPESTGAIEPWGKAASNNNKALLEEAKTIVIETEPMNATKVPQSDSTGTRYLVWVWASERAVADEDGSQLVLINLSQVQGGYSKSKSASGSAYSDALYDADLQAQAFNLRVWSEEKDPDFYYGEAIVTSLKDIIDSLGTEDSMMGSYVCIEGIVTRTIGAYSDFYMQQTFEDEDTGKNVTYGTYVFSNYKTYACVVPGNELRVVGTVAEYAGNYQLTNVQYSPILPSKKDMKILSTGNDITPEVMTVTDFNVDSNVGIGKLVTIEKLTITGGYGGTANGYQKNAMTLYAKDDSNNEVQIRISNDASVKEATSIDASGNATYETTGSGMYTYVTDYKYYVTKSSSYKLTLTGLKGRYQSQTNEENIVIQLCLISEADITFIPR